MEDKEEVLQTEEMTWSRGWSWHRAELRTEWEESCVSVCFDRQHPQTILGVPGRPFSSPHPRSAFAFTGHLFLRGASHSHGWWD